MTSEAHVQMDAISAGTILVSCSSYLPNHYLRSYDDSIGAHGMDIGAAKLLWASIDSRLKTEICMLVRTSAIWLT